jgi:mono/diheme cytochrome c family protein
MKRITLLAPLFMACLALAAWSQQPAAETAQKKTIKKVPITQTAANSGEEMYTAYCAACHGKLGKGDGPAASELKVPPPDLSMLAKNNGGKFPSAHVGAILRFGTSAPAHGSKDMPIWGQLLGTKASSGTSSSEVQLRIMNLTNHIESLQAK